MPANVYEPSCAVVSEFVRPTIQEDETPPGSAVQLSAVAPLPVSKELLDRSILFVDKITLPGTAVVDTFVKVVPAPKFAAVVSVSVHVDKTTLAGVTVLEVKLFIPRLKSA